MNKFKIESQFKPTGDQPQAIKQLTQWVKKDTPHQTLLGVTGSGKTFTLANMIQNTQKPTLVISHNKTLAAQLYQEFRDFFPNNAVSYFVSYYDYYQPEAYVQSTDTYIEKEVDINDEIDRLRLSATANLLSRKDVIVIASVSCIYNLGSPLDYGKQFVEIVPGQVISRQSLISRFIDIQYERSDFELKRGAFRVKGDTITIWPGNTEFALKINLLEKIIENITPIHPVTGETITAEEETINPDHKHNRFIIYPAKHYMAADVDMDDAFKQIKTDLAYRLKELKNENKIVEAYRLNQKVSHDLEMIQEFGYVNGIENYSRYFDGREPGDAPYTLLDYFHYNAKKFNTDGFTTIIDESHITVPQLRGMYYGDRSRKENLIDFGFRLPSALDNRPLKFEEIMARLPQVVYASATPDQWELDESEPHVAEQLIRPTGLLDPQIDIRPTKGQIPDLVKEIIKRKKKGQRVLVTTLTKRTAEALTEYLNNPDKINKVIKSDEALEGKIELPKVQYLHADIDTLDRSDILDSLREGEYDVVVGINLLREGLDLPEVSLVAILEADKEGFLRSTTSLIQTMGRAARHQEGQVIMYADTVTGSMKRAIDEVDRRRKIQEDYNKKHGITPSTIQKPLRKKLLKRSKEEDQDSAVPKPLKDFGWNSLEDIDADTLTPKDKIQMKKKLKRLMNQAAKDWEFEQAAAYRDAIEKLD